MTNSNESRASSMMNGADINLGMAIGQLQATSAQNTIILSEIRQRLDTLPERMTEAIKAATPVPVVPVAATDWGKILDSGKETLKALAPVLFLIAVIFKRAKMPEMEGVIRQMLGLGG